MYNMLDTRFCYRFIPYVAVDNAFRIGIALTLSAVGLQPSHSIASQLLRLGVSLTTPFLSGRVAHRFFQAQVPDYISLIGYTSFANEIVCMIDCTRFLMVTPTAVKS